MVDNKTTTPALEVPRPNTDLLQDTGACLTKAPKAEFNT